MTAGRPSNPVDIEFAGTLRSDPGQWHRYPAEKSWPAEDTTKPAVVRSQANRLRVRSYGAFGTYPRTAEGKYQVRATPTEGIIEMRYLTTA